MSRPTLLTEIKLTGFNLLGTLGHDDVMILLASAGGIIAGTKESLEMSHLNIYLLGSPYLELENKVIQVPRRKLWALLARLCLSHAPLRRDTLAALIWPNVSHARARLSLSRHLSELKALLGSKWLIIEHEYVHLRRSPDFWSDVDEFHRLSLPGENGGTHDLARLEQAVTLYRDDFFAGFTLSDSAEFDDWQSQQREEFRRTLALVLESLVQGYIERGTAEAALTFAHRWLALDKYHEPAHCQLMRLYALTNQRAAAIQQYRLCAQLLADEFQAPPSDQTTELYHAILQDRYPSAEIAASSIERVGILSPRHNLSPPLTQFVGREAELSKLGELLLNSDARLVTILGPGGIGKSRLAMEAASRHIDHFADGAWFVSLAAYEASKGRGAIHSLVTALVNALPATFYGDGSLTDQLTAYLEDKEMLIIYDSFEHLLSAAPFMSKLLRQAPHIKVLVTSRVRLNLQEEWLLALDGLPIPSGNLSHQREIPGSAVDLFSQHASRVRQDFDLTAEQADVIRICRLVDGLPLGIELAAPWVRLLSCTDIVAEIERNVGFLSTTLHTIPERHRTLRAVFNHSWHLLSPDEQTVLMKLSILHGFARAEAESVAGATLPILAALVDHSFLQVTAEGRYAIHEHLRHFAVEQLERTPGAYAQACSHHSHTYLAFVRTQGRGLFRDQVKEALANIAVDIENVRAAWRWAQEHEYYEEMAQTVENLGMFYEFNGWLVEAKEFFSQAVAWLRPLMRSSNATIQDATQEAHFRQILLAGVLAWQGWFMARVGLHPAAKEAIDESIALLMPLGDSVRRQLAFTHDFRGDLSLLARKPDAALPSYQRAYELFSQLDDQYGMGLVLVGMSQVHLALGHYREAEASAQQSLHISTQIGDMVNKGYALSTLARVAYVRGHYALADAIHQECLQLRRESGDRTGMAFTLHYLGDIALWQQRWEQARDYYEECIKQSEAVNLVGNTCFALYGLGNVALAQDDTEAAFASFQAGLARCTEAYIPYASPGYVGLGRIALRRGHLDIAKGHLQTAVALTKTSQASNPLPALIAWTEYLIQRGAWQQATVFAAFLMCSPSLDHADRKRAKQQLDTLDAILPAKDFAAFRADGERATLDELVATVLTDFAG